MGNYRFKLSDVMPTAWFYKLKDMGRTRKQTQTTQSKKKSQSSQASTTSHSSSKSKQPHQCNPRKSYYFTRELDQNHNRIYTSPPKNQTFSYPIFPLETPRKSSKQKPKRRTRKISSSSPKNTFSPVVKTESPEPEIRTDRILPTESFDETISGSTNDIIIDIDNNSIVRKDDKLDSKLNGCDSFSKLMLPPIVTKPEKFNDLLNDAKKRESKPRTRISSHEESKVKGSLKVKIVKEDSDSASMREQRNTPVRRFSVSSQGVRLRMNSPRISNRKIRRSVSSTTGFRRSLSDSFAVVKSSFNPQRDFRESMVEMIVQNNIRTSKDLEDLLACYLCLNSDEYHDLIIKVFKQIWFDLTDTH